ncbi:MAG: hypothetical protein IPI49_29545, partial [Myxococcales bacterium]|nr:hypothetical protein [Myxococcales bacterium]
MTLFRRNTSLAIFAAVAAGVTWAVATGVVVNYPAAIVATVSVSSETVSSVKVDAYLPSGGYPATTTVTGPSPATVNVGVDGGNWADIDGNPLTDDDPGAVYNVYSSIYMNNPASQNTMLYMGKYNVVVNNTTTAPSVSVPVSFNPTAVYRANASVSVIGSATISYYYIYASPASNPPGEMAYGRVDGGTNSQTSVSTWAPMVPNSSVYLYGTVYLQHADGSSSQRSLATQTVNMSSGAASVSWTIDLTNTGHVEGMVVATSPAATPSGYQVVYQGASTSTSGIYGQVNVNTGTMQYAVDLAPGDYDVYLRTNFSTPSSQTDAERFRITVTAGGTTVKDFNHSFGVLRSPLQVSGFFDNSSLAGTHSRLRSVDYSRQAYRWSLSGGVFDHVVSYGTWKKLYTYMSLANSADPLVPLNTQIYRHDYDSELGSVDVASGGPVDLTQENVTLVRSNVYFDVVEPSGGPPIQVSSPWLYLYRSDLNPNGTQRRYTVAYAYGSATPQAQSGFTVVGEPGPYVIGSALATVNGQQTNFRTGPGIITFGNPVPTPAGAPSVVLASQSEGSRLNLSVGFENVATAGITTVVENPLGPAPPEGFSMACQDPVLDDNGVSICDPIYYDISSTATWTGSTKVCIRRRSVLPNGVAEDLLKLNHYNTTTLAWEQLPAPTDGTPAFLDCSADPAACGCADEASCGIDYSGAVAINVYQVCGMTTSFSPFALFQGKLHFSNKVNGVEYTGPTGPPTLQQWVVPGTGTYRITAAGARGAGPNANPSLKGGCGAEVTGEFVLQEGQVVQMLVGQKGTSSTNSAGGGGGTFVTKSGVAMLIAGGGGVRSGALVDGRHASLGAAGVAGSTSSSYASGFIAGGINGGGGARVASYGAGGGGWSGNGAADGTYGDGGFAFTGPSQGRGG